MKPNEVPTPELDKRSKILDDSHKLGEFLDWLETKGYRLGAYVVELAFEPGERYEIEEYQRYGRTMFRIRDRGSVVFTEYLNRKFDDRAEAEAYVAQREAQSLEYAEQHKVFREQSVNPEKLLAEYFDIDLDKIEQERRALLGALRS